MPHDKNNEPSTVYGVWKAERCDYEETASPIVTKIDVNPANDRKSYWVTAIVKIAVVNTKERLANNEQRVECELRTRFKGHRLKPHVRTVRTFKRRRSDRESLRTFSNNTVDSVDQIFAAEKNQTNTYVRVYQCAQAFQSRFQDEIEWLSPGAPRLASRH